MKKLSAIVMVLGLLITGLLIIHGFSDDGNPGALYRGSRFIEVWDQVRSDPWEVYPKYQVRARDFYDGFRSRLYANSLRTVNSSADILPPFRKLIHANGICFRGTWNIFPDNPGNPYTGYFRNGSVGLIIARVSIGTSYRNSGGIRPFGFAGKLYPTTDPYHPELLRPANFVMIDRLSGSRARRFTDVEERNWPLLGWKLTPYFLNLSLSVGNTFALTDYIPFARPIYEISELGGEAPGSNLVSPRWMRIGEVRFVESAVSRSCDHRLHFHHPLWKKTRDTASSNSEAY